MSTKKIINGSLVLGATLTISSTANANPFYFTEVGEATSVRAALSSNAGGLDLACGGKKEGAAKSGDQKCGAKSEDHKCGAKSKDHKCGAKSEDHKCGAKSKDHKCGAKSEDHKCGAKLKDKKKASDHKCGEATCGGKETTPSTPTPAQPK